MNVEKLNKSFVIRKLIPVALLLVLALFSYNSISSYASSPEAHKHSLESLNDKQDTVLKLTAVSAALSATITMIPGDVATPIAEKLADMSTYFLIVICAIYLEKYLLTLTGYATFKVLLPLACLMLMIYIIWNKKLFIKLALKLAAFGLAIFLVVPTSVLLSDIIENTYESSVQSTIDEYEISDTFVESNEGRSDESSNVSSSKINNGATNNSVSETSEEDVVDTEKKKSPLDKIGSFFSNTSDKIKDAVSQVGSISTEMKDEIIAMLNKVIEAVAVMIVTACIIPLLVLGFFVWIIKSIFDKGISI